jgi:hypothetical protein
MLPLGDFYAWLPEKLPFTTWVPWRACRRASETTAPRDVKMSYWSRVSLSGTRPAAKRNPAFGHLPGTWVRHAMRNPSDRIVPAAATPFRPGKRRLPQKGAKNTKQRCQHAHSRDCLVGRRSSAAGQPGIMALLRFQLTGRRALRFLSRLLRFFVAILLSRSVGFHVVIARPDPENRA